MSLFLPSGAPLALAEIEADAKEEPEKRQGTTHVPRVIEYVSPTTKDRSWLKDLSGYSGSVHTPQMADRISCCVHL